MMLAPRVQITADVDPFAVGPWLCVEVGKLQSGAGVYSLFAGAKAESGNLLPGRSRQDRLQGQFSFAGYYQVGACVEIFIRITCRFRAAQNHPPAAGFRA